MVRTDVIVFVDPGFSDLAQLLERAEQKDFQNIFAKWEAENPNEWREWRRFPSWESTQFGSVEALSWE
jgi:hypothetical protein